MGFLLTLIAPDKIIPTIIAFISSTFFLKIIELFFKHIKTNRCLAANEDFLKIFIFYITQKIIPSKKEVIEIKEYLARKHSIQSSTLYSMELMLQEISSYVLLSETISSRDKLKFYKSFKARRSQLIDNNHIQKENILYLYLKYFFQETIFIFSLLLLITLISMYANNNFPMDLVTMLWILFLLFLLSCLGALASRILIYIADKTNQGILFLCEKITFIYIKSHQKK